MCRRQRLISVTLALHAGLLLVYIFTTRHHHVTGGPARVLFVAYLRGGSTLAGELLAAHPHTFYLFEPAYTSHIDWYKSYSYLLNNDTSTEASDVTNRSVIDPLLSSLDCSFENVPIEWLLNPNYFLLGYSGLQSYAQCARRQGIESYEQLDVCFKQLANECTMSVWLVTKGQVHRCYDALVKARHQWPRVTNDPLSHFVNCTRQRYQQLRPCVADLERTCRKAKVRAIKEVMVDMRHVHTLLVRDPEVKVIHLVRDPRGILLSRKTAKRQTIDEDHASLLCTRILENLATERRIQRQLPGSTMLLRYEDLVLHPGHTARAVYRHVGVGESEGEEMLVAWQQRIANPTDNVGDFRTYRKNSRDEAFDWLGKLSDTDRRLIESVPACVDVIRELDYPKLLSRS